MTKKRDEIPPVKRRGKRGPPADADVIARATDDELTKQIEETALAVMQTVRENVQNGQTIDRSHMTAFRLCLEWHTDHAAVKSALRPDDEGSE